MPIDIDNISSDNFGFDLGGPLSVDKGVVRVIKMIRCGGDTDDHDCFAVAAKRELEKTREFAVAVGYMAHATTALAKRVDAVAKRQ